MLRKSITFTLVLLLNAFSWHCDVFGSETGNRIDSLQKQMDKELTDTLRILTALRISDEYSKSDARKALEYAETAISWAEKTGNKRLLAIANNQAGLACFNLGLLEESAMHFSNYMGYAQAHNQIEGMSRVLINISAVRLQLRQFEKAEETLIEGLDIFLKKVSETNDSIARLALATIYNNLGIVSKEKGDLKMSVQYYNKGLAVAATIPSQNYIMANLYNNLGMAYSISGEYAKAFDALDKALNIRIINNDKQGIAASYRNLGLYSEKIGDDKLAKTHYYNAIAIAKETGSKTLLEGIYDNVFNLYKRLENADSALKYHILLKEQHELINTEETTKVLTGLELTMQFQEKEKLRKAEQKRKEQWYFFAGLLLVMVVTIIGLLYILSQARLRRLRLEQTNSELSNKNLQLTKLQLELELETKNKELATNVMYQIQKNEMVEGIVQKLLKHSPQFRKENQELIAGIIHDLEKTMEDSVWNEFEMRFQHVHNDFYNKLNELNPDLTTNERRLCAFLRLNMTTKEIASITGQSQRSIEVARTRLRKKLHLTNSEQGLIEYLSQV